MVEQFSKATRGSLVLQSKWPPEGNSDCRSVISNRDLDGCETELHMKI